MTNSLVLYDMFAVSAAYFAALLLRFDMRFSMIPELYFDPWLDFAPFYAVYCVIIFWALRLYKSIWRFASITELQRIILATLITTVVHAGVITIVMQRMPISYYLIGAILQFFLIVGIRFAYRFVLLLRASTRKDARSRVLLVGAGSAGQIILRDIKRTGGVRENVVCIIDDNPNKWNREVEGVPVVGGRESIPEAVREFDVDKIYVAIPSASAAERRDILDMLKVSRENLENVMAAILDEKKVIFRMGNRSTAGRRFEILNMKNEVIVNSLDSLSTGQLALFELFSTIIQYADNDNIHLSHRLEEIKGIVVIDEVELHLHTELQRNVLPKLIKMFPKIQFIITSHSPLFLLGMRDAFGEDNFSIIEMPKGNKISTEEFSEFDNAYRFFVNTNRHKEDITKYKEEILNYIENDSERPLVITEGSTDWKHLKAALNALKENPDCDEWIHDINVNFLEYEPKNSSKEGGNKIQMSGSELARMCLNYSYVSQNKVIIFIADNDVEEISKELQQEDGSFKSWGNNVFSFCLPRLKGGKRKITIKPGKTKYVKYKVIGRTTWHKVSDFRIITYFKYHGKKYKLRIYYDWEDSDYLKSKKKGYYTTYWM